MIANYQAALDAGSGPYFMWRAYDDLSDLGYVESLVAALDAYPDAVLAAPRVDTVRTFSGKTRVTRPPLPEQMPRNALAAERWMIRRLQAGWFYGLFRREVLADTFAFTTGNFHFAWAGDQLMLAAIALRGRIVGVPEAVMTLQLTGAAKEYSSSEEVAERISLARNYWRVLEKLLADKHLPLHQRWLHRATFVWHMQRRVAKWPLLLRAAIGGAGTA
jgi:hypothetical protein